MPKLPILKGKELVEFIESIGFTVTRVKGSHFRMRSQDGKSTTIPVHANRDLPKGLLRKIIREDLEISSEDFLTLYSEYKGKKSYLY